MTDRYLLDVAGTHVRDGTLPGASAAIRVLIDHMTWQDDRIRRLEARLEQAEEPFGRGDVEAAWSWHMGPDR